MSTRDTNNFLGGAMSALLLMGHVDWAIVVLIGMAIGNLLFAEIAP